METVSESNRTFELIIDSIMKQLKFDRLHLETANIIDFVDVYDNRDRKEVQQILKRKED